jgi:hypothetical protein
MADRTTGSTNKVLVITGPPGSGKTPIVRALAASGSTVVAEPAREVIAEQRAVDGSFAFAVAIAVWWVTLIAACRTTAPLPNRSAQGDIEVLVKQALEDRLAAGNLPDGHLLDSSRVAIREDMPGASMRLGGGALPQRNGYEFYLISRRAAQAESERSKRRIHFIVVDNPRIDGDAATISLGVDVVEPFEPGVVSMCCCTGRGQFRNTGGRWVFVKWAGVVCR